MLPVVAPVRCKEADFLLFSTPDLISRHLRQRGEWEPYILRMSEFMLGDMPAPLVLDIGANLGAYSVPMAKFVQARKGSVLALEPQRIIYYQLCGNVFLNRLDNVVALHMAAGAATGTIDIPLVDYAVNPNIGAFSLTPEFRPPYTRGAISQAASEKVPITALDDLATPRTVSLIKLDVEGHENEVLRGGQDFLRRHGFPPIIFEMWDFPWFAEGRAELTRSFADLGYHCTAISATDYVAQHADARNPVRFRREGDRLIADRSA